MTVNLIHPVSAIHMGPVVPGSEPKCAFGENHVQIDGFDTMTRLAQKLFSR
jgi:hypothetical protein